MPPMRDSGVANNAMPKVKRKPSPVVTSKGKPVYGFGSPALPGAPKKSSVKATSPKSKINVFARDVVARDRFGAKGNSRPPQRQNQWPSEALPTSNGGPTLGGVLNQLNRGRSALVGAVDAGIHAKGNPVTAELKGAVKGAVKNNRSWGDLLGKKAGAVGDFFLDPANLVPFGKVGVGVGMVAKAGEHVAADEAAAKAAQRALKKMMKDQELKTKGRVKTADEVNRHLWVSGQAGLKPGEKVDLRKFKSSPFNLFGSALYGSDSEHVKGAFAGFHQQDFHAGAKPVPRGPKNPHAGEAFVVKTDVHSPLDMDANPMHGSGEFHKFLNQQLVKHGAKPLRPARFYGSNAAVYYDFQDRASHGLPVKEAEDLIKQTNLALHETGRHDAFVSTYGDRRTTGRKPLAKKAGKRPVNQLALLKPTESAHLYPTIGPSKSDLHSLFAYMNKLRGG